MTTFRSLILTITAFCCAWFVLFGALGCCESGDYEPLRYEAVTIFGEVSDDVLATVRGELARCGIGLVADTMPATGAANPCAPHELRRVSRHDVAAVVLTDNDCSDHETARAYTNLHYGVTVVFIPEVVSLADTLLHELGHHLGIPNHEYLDDDGRHCAENDCAMSRAYSARPRPFGPLCCEDLKGSEP